MKVLHLRGPIPLFTNTFVLLDEQGMRDYLQGRQQVNTQNARLRACRADER